MVTELCAAALPATRDLRTAGTPEGDDCVPDGRQRKHQAKVSIQSDVDQHHRMIYVEVSRGHKTGHRLVCKSK